MELSSPKQKNSEKRTFLIFLYKSSPYISDISGWMLVKSLAFSKNKYSFNFLHLIFFIGIFSSELFECS